MSLSALGVSVGSRLVDVTLTFVPGTLTVVVGENGAGKSTLLDVLSGVLAPKSGAVRLTDASARELDVAALAPRDRARRIASLGQRPVDVDDITAAERIAHGLAPRRGSHALVDGAARARIEAAAGALGVAPLLGRALGTLSSGERRRVEVARALVDDEAPVLIVDEPHAGVDVRHQGLVSRALVARARAGATVVASVHELGAAAFADRLVGLRDGRVVVDGAPDDALSAASVDALYGVSGAVVVRESGAVAVLMPR